MNYRRTLIIPGMPGAVRSFLLPAILFTLLFSAYPHAYAAEVETPDSFMARHKSSYKATLDELIKEYRKWCVVAGKPVIPLEPAGQGQPPGGTEQPPGGLPGGYEMCGAPDLGVTCSYELEKVTTSWNSQGGVNPFSWISLNGIFQTSSSESTTTQCTGSSRNFKASGRSYVTGILLNESSQSCALVDSGGSVYFSTSDGMSHDGMYVFGYVWGSGWTGTEGQRKLYGTTYTGTYRKNGKSVTITFKVTNSTPDTPTNAVLWVTSVVWS
jgi:hypothetical protein